MKTLKLIKQTTCKTEAEWNLRMRIEVTIRNCTFDDINFDYVGFDNYIRHNIEGESLFPEMISVMVARKTEELMAECGAQRVFDFVENDDTMGITVRVSTLRDDRHMNVISEVTR